MRADNAGIGSRFALASHQRSRRHSPRSLLDGQSMQIDSLTLLDVVGIYVFALSGCLVAIRGGMDVVGVLALGVVTGFGGGVVRDVLIADLPPSVVRSDWLLLVPVGAALTALVAARVIDLLHQPVVALDAIGLGLYAAVGAAKAVDADLGVVPAVLVGTVSAVGGGLIRDLLADQVPQILTAGSRLYAIPAALGAAIVAVGQQTATSPALLQAVAVASTVVFRLLAVRFDWRAPVPHRLAERGS